MAKDQQSKSAADPSQEWQGPAPATHTRPTRTHTAQHINTHATHRKHTRSTTHPHTPATTPPPQADPSQQWRGTAPGPSTRIGGRSPTTDGKPQPGMAGNRTKGPQPGMARYQPPERAAYPSQEWGKCRDAHRHTHHTTRTQTPHATNTLEGGRLEEPSKGESRGHPRGHRLKGTYRRSRPKGTWLKFLAMR